MSEHRMTELLDKLRAQPKTLGIAAMDLDVLEYGIKALGEDHVARIWLGAPTRFTNRDRVLWTAEIVQKQLPRRDAPTDRFADLKAERAHQNALEKIMKYRGVDLEAVGCYEETLENPGKGKGSSSKSKRRKDQRTHDPVSQSLSREPVGERDGARIPVEINEMWGRALVADAQVRERRG
jgi:hypothetical protein